MFINDSFDLKVMPERDDSLEKRVDHVLSNNVFMFEAVDNLLYPIKIANLKGQILEPDRSKEGLRRIDTSTYLFGEVEVNVSDRKDAVNNFLDAFSDYGNQLNVRPGQVYIIGDISSLEKSGSNSSYKVVFRVANITPVSDQEMKALSDVTRYQEQ
jgi:hypothetical protein